MRGKVRGRKELRKHDERRENLNTKRKERQTGLRRGYKKGKRVEKRGKGKRGG